jgi:folate-binding protein YgfZ
MTNNLYIELENRGVLRLSGTDARSFLQGLITSDMNKVSATKAIYATMLTPQGKFLYDFFIAEQDGSFIIDVNKEQLPAIVKKLSMYKLRSDVKIEDVSGGYKVVALVGDGALPLVGETSAGNAKQIADGVVFVDPRSAKLFVRGLVGHEYKPGFEAGKFAEYEKIRIEAGIASGDIDMESEGAYPLFFGMDELNGVDFKKGCYVGQEVTARMHHKTELRKKIYVIEAVDKLPLQDFGAEVTAGDEKIGKLLSSSGSFALALLLREKVDNQNFVYRVGEREIIIRK